MSKLTASPDEVNKVLEEGGDALQDALQSELSPAEYDPSAVGEKPESKGTENADTEDETEDDQDPSSDEESTDEELEDESPDQDESEDESDSDSDPTPTKTKKPSKAAKKIKKLLSQRSSARQAEDDATARAEAAEARIKELEGKSSEDKDDSESDDDSEEEELSEDEVIDRKLDERDAAREQRRKLDDLDTQEREELIENYRPTKEEIAEVDKIISENPKLSDTAALKIVNPSLFVEESQINRQDAKKLGSGTKPRRTLRKETAPKDMSNDELESELLRQIDSGEAIL